MLKKFGCSHAIVSNGLDAYRQAMSGEFDLVLMDCQMPQMDGFEATRRIREDEITAGKRRIPIAALTANAIKGDKERCLVAGMDAYLSKPVNVKALIHTMDDLIRGREGGAPTPPEPIESIAAVAPAAAPPHDQPAPELPLNAATLLERCMFDPRIARKILDMFVKQIPLSMEQLQRHLAARDAAEVARVAHSIKGAAANASAERVREFAFEIEELGRAADLTAAALLVPLMENAFRECREFIHVSLTDIELASPRLHPASGRPTL
jgi:CheY-like chemotaxis protein